MDEKRVVDALKALATGERDEIERSVDVDEVLRYFAVQTFVANLDSYLGSTGHNYFLYEEDGRLAMLPWDYNLAFGTYALGRCQRLREPAHRYAGGTRGACRATALHQPHGSRRLPRTLPRLP